MSVSGGSNNSELRIRRSRIYEQVCPDKPCPHEELIIEGDLNQTYGRGDNVKLRVIESGGLVQILGDGDPSPTGVSFRFTPLRNGRYQLGPVALVNNRFVPLISRQSLVVQNSSYLHVMQSIPSDPRPNRPYPFRCKVTAPGVSALSLYFGEFAPSRRAFVRLPDGSYTGTIDFARPARYVLQVVGEMGSSKVILGQFHFEVPYMDWDSHGRLPDIVPTMTPDMPPIRTGFRTRDNRHTNVTMETIRLHKGSRAGQRKETVPNAASGNRFLGRIETAQLLTPGVIHCIVNSSNTSDSHTHIMDVRPRAELERQIQWLSAKGQTSGGGIPSQVRQGERVRLSFGVSTPHATGIWVEHILPDGNIASVGDRNGIVDRFDNSVNLQSVGKHWFRIWVETDSGNTRKRIILGNFPVVVQSR